MDASVNPLEGQSCWLITDAKTGMDVQCRGVADALDVAYTFKHVSPRGVWQWLAPWGPVAPAERFAREGSPFAPPFPELAIATGRQSIPYLRALRRVADGRMFTVVLQDPRRHTGIADLIWVPEHDRLRGDNVITTLTAPHSFSPRRLAALRAAPPAAITALPRPCVAVVLGGPNAVYRYVADDLERLRRCMAAVGEEAGGFLITPSRRTPAAVVEAVEAATRERPRLIWDGTGDNPYPDYLANADALVVTADSVNITGEAAATGRPVLVFEPTGGSDKFRRFHEALRRYGATRALTASSGQLAGHDYAPLDSAAAIAARIIEHWRRRTPVAG